MERKLHHDPDYNIPPGSVLAEFLETYEMTQAELAKRTGRSPKLISEILSGNAPIEPETAIQFERVFGVDAVVWTNLQSTYDTRKAQMEEQKRLAESRDWAKRFPVKELVKQGFIEKPADSIDKVSRLLQFLGVATPQAWSDCVLQQQAAFRHSPTFDSEPDHVATWLRAGEQFAQDIEVSEFSIKAFREALPSIRSLTIEPQKVFIPRLREICAEVGVRVVIVPKIGKIRLWGASRWWRDSPLIALSGHYKFDDHFWFTFFHEAAHVLKHLKKKTLFVDEKPDGGSPEEDEANVFAADSLVTETDWLRFAARPRFTSAEVQKFAEEQGIAPGIIIGRLQHEQRIPFNRFNRLKQRVAI